MFMHLQIKFQMFTYTVPLFIFNHTESQVWNSHGRHVHAL